ncbi:alpha/beta fold hydrolase [Streptomyces hirsutus]|uniref:alpha/beta fold hydrolase n=1 Tax=Streptomyces hirsutus TaxID=35620 RepID=UPI003677D952
MALTEEQEIKVPGLLSRFVRLQSGVKAHYSTSGEFGPAVVLLHGGIPGSSGSAGFRYMAPFLGAHGFRVYCPDFPGFGLTEDPGRFYAYGQGGQVDYLQDFVNAVALDTFCLGGNSMGCQTSVNYVVAHPERVERFAVIAGMIGDLVTRDEMRAVDNRAKQGPLPGSGGTYDGSETMMRAMIESMVVDRSGVTDELVSMRTAAANRNRDYYDLNMGRVLRPTDPNELIRLTTKGRLDKATIPGIAMFGDRDVLYAVEAAHLQEDALPNVQYFYPENTGHQGQTDRPELHHQVFLEFFRDGKVSWETARAAGISTRRPPNPDLVGIPTDVPFTS